MKCVCGQVFPLKSYEEFRVLIRHFVQEHELSAKEGNKLLKKIVDFLDSKVKRVHCCNERFYSLDKYFAHFFSRHLKKRKKNKNKKLAVYDENTNLEIVERGVKRKLRETGYDGNTWSDIYERTVSVLDIERTQSQLVNYKYQIRVEHEKQLLRNVYIFYTKTVAGDKRKRSTERNLHTMDRILHTKNVIATCELFNGTIKIKIDKRALESTLNDLFNRKDTTAADTSSVQLKKIFNLELEYDKEHTQRQKGKSHLHR